MKVGIGIGSNLGERTAEMTAAFDFLRTLDPVVRISPVYESEPSGCPPGSGKFYNAAAVLDWKGGLFELLGRCQAHEQARGRTAPAGRTVNAPRPVDLDLLFAEDLILRTPRLVLPHPRMVERDFVLRPLADLDPDFPLPGTGATVHSLLEAWDRQHTEPPCRKTA